MSRVNDQISLEQLNKLKNAMAKLQENNRGSLADRFSQTMDVIETPTETNTETITETKIKTETRGEEDDKVLGRGTYLRVDKDEMAAWLYLTPPDKTPDYKKQDLLDYLSRKGVIIGLHQSNLSAMVKKKVYNREILVAQGVSAKESSDGYFEYLFTQGEYGMPKIREDGTVDYSHMSALQNVKAGDKIAIYHRAVQGVDGKTVLGNVMKAKISRDLPPMKGKGITRENDIY